MQNDPIFASNPLTRQNIYSGKGQWPGDLSTAPGQDFEMFYGQPKMQGSGLGYTL